ncbi:MAG: type I-E CRISPR-associated protein Cas7/Cse4/CasC, partial [Clostridiales bacterium]|nr:type I-E CRISPR-associated protein Cas7/Cse4/CasC [Clostridiales bacterium]
YRTKLLGELVKRALVSGCTLSDTFNRVSNPVNPPMDEKTAIKWANLIANVFAKVKTTDGLKSEQLVHVSHDEILTIDVYLAEIAKEGRAPAEKEPIKPLLCNPVTDVDIALFGRMIADSSKNSVEAAAQVAHPITIHPVVVEDDYFTAVDDLNKSEEIAGAGHLGVSEYGAGVFYTYVCVNRELLIENLGGNAELANKAIGSLIECVAKIGPKGKQSTFASRVYASYLMVEQGNQQPRSLTAAFMSPLKTENFVAEGISRLKTERDNIERAYGKCADVVSEMSVQEGKGSLADVLGSVS